MCEPRQSAEELLAPLLACRDGLLAPNMALMQLLCSAPEESIAVAALEKVQRSTSDIGGSHRLREVKRLWTDSPQAFAILKNISLLASAAGETEADWREVFDKAATVSPEASVALYSLGNPELLAEITRELVCCLSHWQLLGPDMCALDLGCGTGRMSAAIADRVRMVVAADTSWRMVSLARQRLSDSRNALVLRSDGRDLSMFTDCSFELVLAVDSFPYLVDAQLADRHVAEAWRVLRPGGHLLIMNHSYRGDLMLDRADIARLACDCGFSVKRNGTADLTLWDGRAFLLQKADGEA